MTHNQDHSAQHLAQLSESELSQVAGGAYGVDNFGLGFYERENSNT